MVRLLSPTMIPAVQRGWRLSTFANDDLKLKVDKGAFPREFDGVIYQSLSTFLFAVEQRASRPGGIVIVEVDDDALELFITYATDDITPNAILAYYQLLGL